MSIEQQSQLMTWFNEPPEWSQNNDKIVIKAGTKTDFWRKTHYGFIRDNGHFYFQTIQGNFTITAKFKGEYQDQFDQAGVMIRLDETNWVKAGIEYVDGIQQISTVVTRDYSDWSVVPSAKLIQSIWIRVKRQGSAFEVFYSLNNQDYIMVRTFYLTEVDKLEVGLMCAAPEGDGFTVTFESFIISTP